MVGKKRPLSVKIFVNWEICLGIIIQDSGNDLNVYRNDTTDSCCKGLSSHDSYSAEKDMGCSAEAGCSPESGLVDARDIDFNEWTGK